MHLKLRKREPFMAKSVFGSSGPNKVEKGQVPSSALDSYTYRPQVFLHELFKPTAPFFQKSEFDHAKGMALRVL